MLAERVRVAGGVPRDVADARIDWGYEAGEYVGLTRIG